jgi:hypothetical protein
VFYLIAAAIIVGAIGVAALYDHRARARGWQVGASVEKSIHYRMPRMFVHRYATQERKGLPYRPRQQGP